MSDVTPKTESPTIEERIKRAEDEVLRLARGEHRSGGRGFRMTIPVDPNDSDIVLMDGLQAGREAASKAVADVLSHAVRYRLEGCELVRDDEGQWMHVDNVGAKRWKLDAALIASERRTGTLPMSDVTPKTESGRALIDRRTDDISMYEHEWLATVLTIEQEAASKAVAEVLDRLEAAHRNDMGYQQGCPTCALIASERKP